MKRFIITIAAICGFATLGQAQQQFQKTSLGTEYTIISHGTGDKIKLDDVITFNLTQKTDKDSVLASSYQQGKPFYTKVQAQGPLMDVFQQLTVKDSALVRVPVDTMYKGHEDALPPFLKKGSYVYFAIKIEKVQSLQQAMAEQQAMLDKMKNDEAAQAAKFIADNKINFVSLPSGLKYLVTQPSVKRKVMPGDSVYVNYTGALLNGTVFDSSVADVAKKAGLDQPGRPYEPIAVVIGEHSVIPGWEEGLQQLHEGEKARFLIPSALGYGQQGSPNGVIPPYATLLFDIEVVKVVHKPVAPVAKKPLAKKPLAKKTTATKKS